MTDYNMNAPPMLNFPIGTSVGEPTELVLDVGQVTSLLESDGGSPDGSYRIIPKLTRELP